MSNKHSSRCPWGTGGREGGGGVHSEAVVLLWFKLLSNDIASGQ